MRLLFLRGPSSLAKASPQGRGLAVCFDWWTRESLVAQRIPHVVADDLITFEEGIELDRMLYSLVWDWSCTAEGDFSEWHDIALGQLYFVELLTGCFVPYAKMIRATTRLVA